MTAHTPVAPGGTVALVTLGCARNDVDSEELAGRLAADGFTLVDDLSDAETVVVNTCGFVEAAKKDSVDTLLAAADLKHDGRARAVVAVGCLAERYGAHLAESLPEADAVLGFDDYPDIAARLRSVLAGETQHPHTPADRRRLLPISPVERQATRLSVPGHGVVSTSSTDVAVGSTGVAVGSTGVAVGSTGVAVGSTGVAVGSTGVAVGSTDARRPSTDEIGLHGPATGPRAVRRRLDTGPMAPLKLASGCDRRCTFCAIPSFRGSFVSRRPSEVLDEARWLADQGVREVFLVSENSTSYGKDLGDLRLLEALLPEIAAVGGIERVRVSYLQPAETRPGLVDAIAGTPGVCDYFDLSFQHASAPVLRRMRRFGDAESFLGLLHDIRRLAPTAGVRSNVIVGFPGETESDLETLCDFLVAARLDVTGVFGYSDEDGTEAATFEGKLDADEIRDRVEHVTDLVEQLTAQRAEERVGEGIVVLVESDGDEVEGRADHQGPEVDGTTRLGAGDYAVGDLVPAVVVAAEGADLVAEPIGPGLAR